ncbi:hypothetical protein DAEQUDRAFT_153014 [Daedalea quercina L-15889]|uniref:Uncharacterized protein n=1 Tax=Daedalea quercina L-15889 TaxID=1314783 RepID=A0A165RLT1_9APHY|nr:hypothetical protein DAEQUDRAFT_153014 [Daedalea quercina L-15889]
MHHRSRHTALAKRPSSSRRHLSTRPLDEDEGWAAGQYTQTQKGGNIPYLLLWYRRHSTPAHERLRTHSTTASPGGNNDVPLGSPAPAAHTPARSSSSAGSSPGHGPTSPLRRCWADRGSRGAAAAAAGGCRGTGAPVPVSESGLVLVLAADAVQGRRFRRPVRRTSRGSARRRWREKSPKTKGTSVSESAACQARRPSTCAPGDRSRNGTKRGEWDSSATRKGHEAPALAYS